MTDSDLTLKTNRTSWEQANAIAHRALVEAIASTASPDLISRFK